MITTATNRSFIESEVYSKFILQNLHDGLLPSAYYRDVTDFGNGETLHIKTIGEAQIQFVEEDKPITYTSIESGEITMAITDYIGDAWFLSDKMRQDGSQIDTLMAMRAKEATRGIQEYYETKALATLNAGQTAAAQNKVNGFDHRFKASGTNGVMTIEDLIGMKLAFDKAEVPMAGRVAIVDPVVGASLDKTFNLSATVDKNAEFQRLFENGWDRDHQYVLNIMGWNIISSNRLPKIASESLATFGGSTAAAITGAVANIFMCVADDQTKALMSAWRQQPSVEGDRNKDMARDEFVTRARFGFGVQRKDTLGVILTSATAI